MESSWRNRPANVAELSWLFVREETHGRSVPVVCGDLQRLFSLTSTVVGSLRAAVFMCLVLRRILIGIPLASIAFASLGLLENADHLLPPIHLRFAAQTHAACQAPEEYVA